MLTFAPEARSRPIGAEHSVTTTNIRTWLLSDLAPESTAAHHTPAHTAPWWKVMCLTGVDYFSTLGYQPGIAFLAAGFLSPIATLVLVAADAVRRAARSTAASPTLSPHGQGSISMLEELLPALAGQGAGPVPARVRRHRLRHHHHALGGRRDRAHHPEPVRAAVAATIRSLLTLVLLSALGAVFLKGFKEAIGLAVVIVVVYLALNVVVDRRRAACDARHHPGRCRQLADGARSPQHGSPLMMVAVALLAVPEAGARPVGIRDRRRRDAAGPRRRRRRPDAAPHGRIRNTRKLLTTAALIMSVMLIGSSVVTTLLIPADGVRRRAARPTAARWPISPTSDLGDVFGTVYDLATIAILWFAGASAMAGLLNLVPRYLPRYGMAPDWARATRPLVLIFTRDHLPRDAASSRPTSRRRAAPTRPACWC